MQILVGEALLTLLKVEGFIFVNKYLHQLKNVALEMLKLWNADIIEIWVEVYAIVLAKMVREEEFKDSWETIRQEGRKTVITMAERN